MKRIITILLYVLLVCLLVASSATATGLSKVFCNMESADETQTISEAETNLRTQYASAPRSVPAYATFDGYFIPSSEDTKVAVFSDDGVDVYVDDQLVLDKKDVGQHLPSLNQSFNILPVDWHLNQVYHIKIEYSNICYTGQFDIDGCTMYAYNGGGNIKDEPKISVTLSSSKSSISVCDTVTVTATASDIDFVGGQEVSDTVSEFDWYVDGVLYSHETGSNSSEITLQFSTPGQRKIKVVADEGSPQVDDGPASAEIAVGVDNSAEPPVVASSVCSLSSSGPWQEKTIDVGAGTTVYFSGDYQDTPSYDKDIIDGCAQADDTIASYSWDFGDGFTATGAAVNHAYAAAGQYVSIYTASLVADDTGLFIDDSPSEPSVSTVRVFESVPDAPVVTVPENGQVYNGLIPTISWQGHLHDAYQVRIQTTDDPDASPSVWDSGEVISEDSQAACEVELSEDVSYYVFVREHNLLGWGDWSADGHVFTVKAPAAPENMSVSWNPSGPNFTCGTPVTCTVTYREQTGWNNITSADLLIDESSLDGQSACYLRYDPSTDQCWLADEDGMFTLGGEGVTPGSANVLENDEVIVHLEDTSVVVNPGSTDIVISWNLEFKKAFTGPKDVALSVVNNASIGDPDNPEVLGNISVASDGINSIINTPDNNQHISSSSITLGGEAWDTNTDCIGSVDISTDGGETWHATTLAQGQGRRTWSYLWENAEDGTYTIKSRATNCNSEVEYPAGTGIKVTVDTVAPTSSIIAPENDAVIIGPTVEIAGTAFDSTSKVVKVEVCINGGVWNEASLTITGNQFTYSYPIPESANGTSLTIQCRATDEAGNVETPGDGIMVTVTYAMEFQANYGVGETHEDLPGIKTSLFQSQKTLEVGPYSILNLCTGMLLTQIPITTWDSVGKLGVDFQLYHLPYRANCPDFIKDKWMHSYQSVLTEDSNYITIYHPQGGEDCWVKNSTTSFTRYLDTQDTVGRNGTNGFIVTRRDHIKMFYGHSLGNQKWMLSKIQDPNGNEITLQYASSTSPLLTWIKDPDNKRSIYLSWTKVGADKHDALWGAYTSWSFGSKYTQLYWLKYDTSGNMTSIEFPRDMTEYGLGSDLPYVPDYAKTLHDSTFFVNMFRAQPKQKLFFSYQSGNVFGDKLISRIGVGDIYSTSHALCSITYSNYTCLPATGSYNGSMKISEGTANTSVSILGPIYKTEFWLEGWVPVSAKVTATVTWPTGSSTTYTHSDWYVDRVAKENGASNWKGLRIWKVDTKIKDASGNTIPLSEQYNWYGADVYHWVNGQYVPITKQYNSLNWYQDPKGIKTEYTWDDHKLLTAKNLKTNEVTSMTYDGWDLQTVIEPSGKKTLYTYDSTTRDLEKVQVAPDNLNITTDYGYDSFGNMTTITGPYYGQSEAGAPVTTYDYGDGKDGLVKRTTDPLGRFVDAQYTGSGVKYWESQPRTADDQSAAPTVWVYDKAGRPFYTWNSGDRDAITYYDCDGRVYETIDAAGCVTTYTYTSVGDPVDTLMYSKDLTKWLKCHRGYDTARHPTYTLMQDQTGMLKYSGITVYDQLNRVSAVLANTTSEFPVQPKVSYAYDNNGNPKQTTNGRGGTISQEYDNANRLTKVTRSDGKVTKYTYYLVGQNYAGLPWQVFDWTTSDPLTPARVYNAYDSAGRLTDETRNDMSRKIHYEYDAAGRKTQLQIRNISGSPLATYNYQYCLDGKLKSIDYVVGLVSQKETFEYNDFRGRLSKETYPNGTFTEYEYQDYGPTNKSESSSLISSITDRNQYGSALCVRQYTYDVFGNVKTVSDGANTTTYTYDDFSRLLNESRTGVLFPYQWGYTYDPIGNRLTRTVGTATTQYSNDNDNKLRSTANPTGSYYYDADGNLTSKTVGGVATTYGYDVANNLTSISSPSSTYKYNSLGERYEVIDPSGTTRFLYVDGNLLQELDTSGNVKVAYNPGISEARGSNTIYYEFDAHGSTVATTTSLGALTQDKFIYGAYGDAVNVAVPSLTRYQYGGSYGYYTDSGTGLMKLGARYYDPAIGRFITKDPARDGTNWYMYAADNPVNAVDPTGLASLVPVYVDDYYGQASWRDQHLWLNEYVVSSFYDIVNDVRDATKGKGKLVISDMLRTWGEQADVHRRKPGLALPAGKSYHQSGLAFDFSTAAIGMPIADFQSIVRKHGWEPISNETWHIQYPYEKLGYSNLRSAIEDVGCWGAGKSGFRMTWAEWYQKYEVKQNDWFFSTKQW